jgi:pimeloyl-ACP methyl ester carboxylesterase
MRVAVEGGELEVEHAGTGPGVVLIHPGLWDSRTWDDQFAVFAERYHVVRYDLRGYGRSSRPEPGVAYSHVDDLVAVMDAVGLDRAALVGCSVGGGVELETAIAHPGRVWALVLVASALPGFEPTPAEEAWWEERMTGVGALVEAGDVEGARRRQLEIWAPLGVDDPIGRRILQISVENGQELTMDESGERHLDPPAVARLHEISVPTLVLPADHDPPDAQRESRVLAERIPGARIVRIADVDHVVNMRRPAEFNRVVLGFLDEVV